jgi:hypothetical protein
LTDFAVLLRYPGIGVDMENSDYFNELLIIAEDCLMWVEDVITTL